MALVKCPDCGKEHSDSAAACPNCGRPVKAVASVQPTAPKKNIGCGGGCLVLIVIGGILYAIGSSGTNSSTGTIDSSPNAAEVDVGPQLELETWTWGEEYSYAIAHGTVKNISGESLKNVQAVVSFYAKDGTFITSDDALIDYNPILPGQTSPFKVIATHNPAMRKAGIEFKELMGGTIRYREKPKKTK